MARTPGQRVQGVKPINAPRLQPAKTHVGARAKRFARSRPARRVTRVRARAIRPVLRKATQVGEKTPRTLTVLNQSVRIGPRRGRLRTRLRFPRSWPAIQR